MLFSSYPNIAVDFDPETLEPLVNEVEAYDIFRAGLGQDFYGAVLDTLEHAGRYRRMYPGQIPNHGGRSFYVYTYDWRLDNISALQGLHELIEQGNMAFNITIRGGDVINVVPKRVYQIYIHGQVNTPGPQELKDPITLMTAISLAGGLTDRAAATRVTIIRTDENGTQTQTRVNLKDIESGKTPDVDLQPGDVILVPETWF